MDCAKSEVDDGHCDSGERHQSQADADRRIYNIFFQDNVKYLIIENHVLI